MSSRKPPQTPCKPPLSLCSPHPVNHPESSPSPPRGSGSTLLPPIPQCRRVPAPGGAEWRLHLCLLLRKRVAYPGALAPSRGEQRQHPGHELPPALTLGTRPLEKYPQQRQQRQLGQRPRPERGAPASPHGAPRASRVRPSPAGPARLRCSAPSSGYSARGGNGKPNHPCRPPPHLSLRVPAPSPRRKVPAGAAEGE